MKNFTKLFCAAALFMMGAVSASAQERLEATFANPAETGGKWNAATQSLTWNQSWDNRVWRIGLLPSEG